MELEEFIKMNKEEFDDDDDEDDILDKEFENHKRDYYINKLKYSKVTRYGYLI